MADTADMAPTRSTSRRSGKNGTRRSRARGDEALDEQVARLQEDLKSIAATIAAMADDRATEAKGAAKGQVRNLMRTGQQAVDTVQDEFSEMEKQIKDTIRAKPLTAVAGAVAIGFCLALLTR
jgi:ElaB/YqjD/DUF883 family membrane-anchored ribosome-binding protein